MKGRKANGGKAEPKPYNAQGSEVEKEAEEKKRGGKVEKKHVGGEHHKAKKHRLDRPGRKRGGRAGAERSPLSMASKITNAEGHDADTGNADEGP